jgi:hypothetical protein
MIPHSVKFAIPRPTLAAYKTARTSRRLAKSATMNNRQKRGILYSALRLPLVFPTPRGSL